MKKIVLLIAMVITQASNQLMFSEEITLTSENYSTVANLGSLRATASSKSYSNESAVNTIYIPSTTPIVEEVQSFDTFITDLGSGGGGGCLLKYQGENQ